jgi:predicted metal-binding protein
MSTEISIEFAKLLATCFTEFNKNKAELAVHLQKLADFKKLTLEQIENQIDNWLNATSIPSCPVTRHCFSFFISEASHPDRAERLFKFLRTGGCDEFSSYVNYLFAKKNVKAITVAECMAKKLVKEADTMKVMVSQHRNYGHGGGIQESKINAYVNCLDLSQVESDNLRKAAGFEVLPVQGLVRDILTKLRIQQPHLAILMITRDRVQPAVINMFLQYAETNYYSKILYVSIPMGQDITEANFFKSIAFNCELTDDMVSCSTSFEIALKRYFKQYKDSKPIFILIQRFDKGHTEYTRRLVNILRDIVDSPDINQLVTVHILALGGETIYEYKYMEHQKFSAFNIAYSHEWPEISVEELKAFVAQFYSNLDLKKEKIDEFLTVCRGNFNLLRACMQIHVEKPQLDVNKYPDEHIWKRYLLDMFEDLYNPPFHEEEKSAWQRESLELYLRDSEVGYSEELLTKPLLRRLFWRNLLTGSGLPTSETKLTWRLDKSERDLVRTKLPEKPSWW